ncbi:MAG: stage V sporulation protein AA [Tyzzerella sp.]|nr:stage V sporulation protein AA [Tyzzerella sp.]
MSVANETLYIKGEQSVEVQTRDVRLGDLVAMECGQQNIVSKLKTLKILKMPEKGQHRFVISVLKIIECIHKEYPNLEIQNLGSPDFIVTYEARGKKNKFLEGCKIVLVVITTFIGAAFAIMTFNNDSGITTLFDQIYEALMGSPKEGFSILELSYSIGIIVGILVFFNHFGKKKFSVDPTPIEVEMRLYEKDIQTTLIENYSRKGQELDVGKSDSKSGSSGGDRS